MTYERLYVQSNTYFVSTMPHSEVCMSMQIAGERRVCKLFEPYGMVQIYDRVQDITDGKELQPFSLRVTSGEAGVFHDSQGYYVVRESE